MISLVQVLWQVFKGTVDFEIIDNLQCFQYCYLKRSPQEPFCSFSTKPKCKVCVTYIPLASNTSLSTIAFLISADCCLSLGSFSIACGTKRAISPSIA